LLTENVALELDAAVHEMLLNAGGLVKNVLIGAVLFHPAELLAFALK